MIRESRTGKFQVEVYDPAIKKRRYVGQRDGKRAAQQLEREKTLEFKAAAKGETRPDAGLTIREYAAYWLEHHHGPGTSRPSRTTHDVNASNLSRFLEEFGDLAIDGGIRRKPALKWSRLEGNYHRAKTVSAMFNDAVDDEEAQANPFANRGAKAQRGRKDIHPLTEDEVDLLGDIALSRWGEAYGSVFRAAVLFGAWVGSRPGETFGARERDIDWEAGLFTVRRIKPPYNTDTVVVASPVMDALREMHRIANREGLLFPAVSGVPYIKGTLRYYWDPVRSAFRLKVSAERWAELCEGQSDLDFYALRHFAASIIVARGGNEFDVAAQLGNTPEVARETYIHEYRDRQRERLRGLLERPAPVTDLSEVRGKLGGQGAV